MVHWLLVVLQSILLVVFIAACDNKQSTETASVGSVRIAAMKSSVTGYTFYVAREKGFFKQVGLDIIFDSSFPHGKASIAALNEGADMAVSSETPFVHAVLEGSVIQMITSTVSARNHLALVASKDRGVESADDLKGKTVGVTKGSNGEYFLDLVLLSHGVKKSDIQTLDLKPKAMVAALENGTVDAIVSWNPIKHQAISTLRDRATVLVAEGIYTPRFLVSASKTYIESNPAIIKKVIEALQLSTEFIREHGEEAGLIANRYLNINVPLLEELGATYIFDLALDQELLSTLEDQAQWSLRRSGKDSSERPDFLKYIYLEGLEEVLPDQMTIIH